MKSAKLDSKLGRVLTPMVTPFDDRGHVNYGEAERLADYIIGREYCDCIIVAGTTGEFYSLSTEERIELFAVVKKVVGGRVPVVAGAGSAYTGEVINLVKEAEKMDYEVAMVTAPFYCMPTQEGVYQFYKTIAESTSMQILLYNIPLFAGVNIDPETVTRLAGIKNITGIKEESGINPTQLTDYALATSEDFTIYNGDDIMVLCSMLQGAAGVISGGSHLIGDKIKNMIDFFLTGQNQKALEIHRLIYPLFKAFGQNGRFNPVPILRAAMEIAGHRVGPARLPLDSATQEEKEIIKKHLIRIGVI
jgi:4-hydroxy-tetrahydrodipicolinate synthase